MMKVMAKRYFVLILAIFIGVGWLALLYKPDRPNEAENLLRLHILANSDSAKDQEIKLKVRDAVVMHLTPQLNNVSTSEEARQIVLSQQEELLKIVQATIKINGGEYPATIETGWFDFPLRSYGALMLPAGKYEAVRILLGNAQGQNWWCVLFPPLCFVDGTGTVAVPANGNNQENQSPQIRWKVVEIIQESLGNKETVPAY